MSTHGGARTGAGRPVKWPVEDVLIVGYACELKSREASTQAVQERLSGLPHADEIRMFHDGVQMIPLSQRRAWLGGNAHEDHRNDVEGWLHKQAGTPFDDGTAVFDGEAPRGFSVLKKPPRGTRRRILGEVAIEKGLSSDEVDNLWQAYRRLQREPQDTDDS